MSKIKLLAFEDLLPAEMAKLESEFDVIRLWKEADPEGAIHKYALEIKAILSCPGPIAVSRKMIEALPNLEIIAQNGVGYDNIDVAAAHARSVVVTNTPGVLTDDTADTAIALLLSVSRRIAEGDMFIRAGRWNGGDLPLGTSLSGKLAGIVGMGRIGRAIATRCTAFNMHIAYHGPHQKADVPYRYYPDLITLARDADYLILACKGGVDTQNLINRAVLDAMKPRAFLINIARGSVVDQDALVEKLVNQKIAGAGLDVFAHEPDVPGELKSLDNVVLTPHIGSATLETRSKMGQLVLDNLAAHFAGQPLLTPVV